MSHGYHFKAGSKKEQKTTFLLISSLCLLKTGGNTTSDGGNGTKQGILPSEFPRYSSSARNDATLPHSILHGDLQYSISLQTFYFIGSLLI